MKIQKTNKYNVVLPYKNREIAFPYYKPKVIRDSSTSAKSLNFIA